MMTEFVSVWPSYGGSAVLTGLSGNTCLYLPRAARLIGCHHVYFTPASYTGATSQSAQWDWWPGEAMQVHCGRLQKFAETDAQVSSLLCSLSPSRSAACQQFVLIYLWSSTLYNMVLHQVSSLLLDSFVLREYFLHKSTYSFGLTLIDFL